MPLETPKPVTAPKMDKSVSEPGAKAPTADEKAQRLARREDALIKKIFLVTTRPGDEPSLRLLDDLAGTPLSLDRISDVLDTRLLCFDDLRLCNERDFS